MQDEFYAIQKNQTWILTKWPIYKNVIRVKWIYNTKLNENGNINELKAKLVVKGYSQ